MERSAASRLFHRLDKYLRDNKLRTQELFNSYDTRRKGYLNLNVRGWALVWIYRMLECLCDAQAISIKRGRLHCASNKPP